MYEFNITLKQTFDTAVDAVIAAISAEKLGVVSDINAQAIMKKKLDREIGGYRILGACAPDLAIQALDAEPNSGVLLPCNIVVREIAEGEVMVVFLKPSAMFALMEADLTAGLSVIQQRLDGVRDRLLAA